MNSQLRMGFAHVLLLLGVTGLPADELKIGETQPPPFHTESVRGKVVWLGAGLKDLFQITTVPESQQSTLAIQTEQGHLLPLAEDLRGRSFRTDERLRGKQMELFVRRYGKHPFLQVLRIYELQDEKKYQVDYWCDVCAIVMFEKGPCACCQDDNRLRLQIVDAQPKNADPDR